MSRALLVSPASQSINFMKQMLKATGYMNIVVANACKEAYRLLSEHTYDLVVVNSPLKDASGEELASYVGENSGQVILLVHNEYVEEITSVTEEYGVITMGKPLSKEMFGTAIRLAKFAGHRMDSLQKENKRLVQKIKDIRLTDRAKYVLISQQHMEEEEAHHYIEREAMNLRVTKRKVAEEILKKYEDDLR